MADKHTPEQRRRMMLAVKSRGNKSTEMAFISLLRANKITGWRRHYPIAGTPDFVFPGHRVALFIDGCFWHKCPKCYRRPQSNKSYWDMKVESNQKRDIKKRALLRRNGWRVIRIWEHELKESRDGVLRKIQTLLSETRS